jgi:hypothetical protein
MFLASIWHGDEYPQEAERQEELWVVTSEVVNAPAHAFYDRLNQLLDLHHFDRSV